MWVQEKGEDTSFLSAAFMKYGIQVSLEFENKKGYSNFSID